MMMIEPPRAFLEGHIMMQEDRLAASTADLVDRHPTTCVDEVCHRYLRAFARKRRRTGGTNPRCAACHDRNLILDPAKGVLPREVSCPTTLFFQAIRVELDCLMIRSISSTSTP